MQLIKPHLSKGETTSRPNIDMFGLYLIMFGRFFRELLLRAESDPGGVNFLSLYLALVYLKPLPELALALPLQRKELSDVMASDH